ncbi:MAG TPA: hypothetical protein VMG12_12945 [Polyangiaceae bacterium]|nr:hypothetical protein [Polyangiaceae bacterium]
MDLATLRRFRRILSAAVSLSAIALVMAKVGATPESGSGVGLVASLGLIVSLSLLVVVWRKEHAASEAAFAERELQQLAFLKLQVELAKKKAEKERS